MGFHHYSPMSRRQALRLFGIAGGAALLAACQQTAPAAPKPTEAAKPTTAPAAASPSASTAASPGASPAASPAAQAASSTAPAANAMTDAQWNDLVAAAKQEGALNLGTYSGGGYRTVVEDFIAAFPGIKVEHQQYQSSSRDLVPRLLSEQKAGVYNWDLIMCPAQEQLRQVKPADGLLPIRPIIGRGDVLDDKNWAGGYEKGYDDIDKKWGYSAIAVRFPVVWINTEMVKDGEVKTIKDLLDPKWKGKMVGADPRTKGSGFVPATVARIRTGGDDIIKQLYKDQEMVLSVDARQLTEFMVRGRYIIGIGAVDKVILSDFLSQGVGTNLKNIDFPELDFVASANNHIFYVNKAPHPKSAQVFANWLLTKDGQTSFSKNVLVNSRRIDVPVVDPDAVPTRGIDYITSDLETFIPEQQKTQDLAKSILD